MFGEVGEMGAYIDIRFPIWWRHFVFPYRSDMVAYSPLVG